MKKKYSVYILIITSGIFWKTFVNQTFSSDLFPDADATISVPVALQWFFTENRTRVNFQFYGTYDLFQVISL